MLPERRLQGYFFSRVNCAAQAPLLLDPSSFFACDLAGYLVPSLGRAAAVRQRDETGWRGRPTRTDFPEPGRERLRAGERVPPPRRARGRGGARMNRIIEGMETGRRGRRHWLGEDTCC